MGHSSVTVTVEAFPICYIDVTDNFQLFWIHTVARYILIIQIFPYRLSVVVGNKVPLLFPSILVDLPLLLLRLCFYSSIVIQVELLDFCTLEFA